MSPVAKIGLLKPLLFALPIAIFVISICSFGGNARPQGLIGPRLTKRSGANRKGSAPSKDTVYVATARSRAHRRRRATRAPGRSRRRARSSSGSRGSKGGADKTVIFETGYGPSGLPHIGTFGEVARTAMVRHAFEVLTEGRRKTRLVCFSDDMDGLRKVPDNVPNKDMLAAHLDKPLSAVPDPVQQRVPELCRAQQRAPAPLPRPVRLRVRVPVGDRVLQGRPVRRHAAAGCSRSTTR